MQQRTTFTNRQSSSPLSEGEETTAASAAATATVTAFGMRQSVPAGRSVAETIANLGLAVQPYQAVRIDGQKVDDLAKTEIKAGEILTITNQVKGG